MQLEKGDIIRVYSKTAGKEKFHLCVFVGKEKDLNQFLFINSVSRKDDCVVFRNEIPCLPQEENAYSAISFSMLPRYSMDYLLSNQGIIKGKLSKQVAQKALEAVKKAKSPTSSEKRIIISALESIINKA